jgi:hypothetical protein
MIMQVKHTHASKRAEAPPSLPSGVNMHTYNGPPVRLRARSRKVPVSSRTE